VYFLFICCTTYKYTSSHLEVATFVTRAISIAGDYSVCVNAATMALIDAGIPMKDFVCACSASYVEDTPILGELHTNVQVRQ